MLCCIGCKAEEKSVSWVAQVTVFAASLPLRRQSLAGLVCTQAYTRSLAGRCTARPARPQGCLRLLLPVLLRLRRRVRARTGSTRPSCSSKRSSGHSTAHAEPSSSTSSSAKTCELTHPRPALPAVAASLILALQSMLNIHVLSATSRLAPGCDLPGAQLSGGRTRSPARHADQGRDQDRSPPPRGPDRTRVSPPAHGL